jgi:hypothetical protein
MGTPLLRTGRVIQILARRARASWLLVDLQGVQQKAISYDDWCGEVKTGDRVLLNVAAVQMGLGTGGHHFVVANLDRLEHDAAGVPSAMKVRYTPAQVPVRPVEEDPRYREQITGFSSLAGMPVVLTCVHSQLAAFVVGLRALPGGGGVRTAAVLTDSSALPAALSDLLANLRARDFLEATITVGQAFGGDYEAVNVYTGLIAAREIATAQVALVGAGPGHWGTGTRYGFSSMDLGEAARAGVVLGGHVVFLPRIDYADPRPRHRGLSHHSLTLLREVIADGVTVVLPYLSGEERDLLDKQVAAEKLATRHELVYRSGAFIEGALQECGFPVLHMGRSCAQDPAFYHAAGAAAGYVLECVGAQRSQARPEGPQGR